ncbi:MAG: bacterioferritin-associated ferredoxin [Phycisphaerales bacterium]
MNPDDQVCLCFRVSLRKIRTYCQREDPKVASLISECLGAGTGCGWCVPFLKHLHEQHQHGETPDLKSSPEEYAVARKSFHKTGDRVITPEEQAAGEAEDQSTSSDEEA